MIGGFNLSNGGGKTFVITFNVTPTTATITVKDEKGKTFLKGYPLSPQDKRPYY